MLHQGNARLTFSRLADAIEFLASHLGSDAEQEMIADQFDIEPNDRLLLVGDRTPRDYRLDAIQALGDVHRARDLRDIYRGVEFPVDRPELTLGGHAKELGHIHLKFRRIDGAWVFAKTFICR